MPPAPAPQHPPPDPPTVAAILTPIGQGGIAVLHVVGLAKGTRVRTVDAGSYVASSPALAGPHAYVGHAEGEFLCVDTQAGEVLWGYGEGDLGFFSAAAVASPSSGR